MYQELEAIQDEMLQRLAAWEQERACVCAVAGWRSKSQEAHRQLLQGMMLSAGLKPASPATRQSIQVHAEVLLWCML